MNASALIIDALPVSPFERPAPAEASATGEPVPPMFDLILRGQRRLDVVLRDDAALMPAIQRMLGLSVLGLGVLGAVLGGAAQLLGASAGSFYARGTPLLWMPLSLVLAFLGALCICLPSFYFYTQLAGLDASFRLVTAQALRAQATTSVLLLGVLPFYAAWVLAYVAGLLTGGPDLLFLGMCLPFAVGLAGIRAAYRGFSSLAEVLPITHHRRGRFLRRMILCWGAVYSVIAPLALNRLADALAQRL